jgi:hypothetical protein
MRFYAISIILLFFISFSVALQAQETNESDSVRIDRIEMPEMPANLDFLQFEINRRASTSPFLYAPPNLVLPLPTEHHLRTFSDFHRVMSAPSSVGITGFGLNFLTNTNRTALFSVGATPNLMFYSAATLGVIRTLQYGNINYYNIDVGAAFLLNNVLSGSVGVFYRSALEFPMPITGAYLHIHHQMTDGLQLFGSGTFQNVELHQFGVSQQSLMLEGRVRQHLTDRLSISAYGGTPVLERSGRAGMPMNPLMSTYYGASLEYWFNETVGAEGGVVWVRDIWSGRMRAQPRFGLTTRPFGRR